MKTINFDKYFSERLAETDDLSAIMNEITESANRALAQKRSQKEKEEQKSAITKKIINDLAEYAHLCGTDIPIDEEIMEVLLPLLETAMDSIVSNFSNDKKTTATPHDIFDYRTFANLIDHFDILK